MDKASIYRILSAALLLFFSIARLGQTGSYFEAIGAACFAYAIWWCGHESNRAAQGGE